MKFSEEVLRKLYLQNIKLKTISRIKDWRLIKNEEVNQDRLDEAEISKINSIMNKLQISKKQSGFNKIKEEFEFRFKIA